MLRPNGAASAVAQCKRSVALVNGGRTRFKPCKGGPRTEILSRPFRALENIADVDLGRCPRLQLNRALGARNIALRLSARATPALTREASHLFVPME
jgi:hypothetical protein